MARKSDVLDEKVRVQIRGVLSLLLKPHGVWAPPRDPRHPRLPPADACSRTRSLSNLVVNTRSPVWLPKPCPEPLSSTTSSPPIPLSSSSLSSISPSPSHRFVVILAEVSCLQPTSEFNLRFLILHNSRSQAAPAGEARSVEYRDARFKLQQIPSLDSTSLCSSSHFLLLLLPKLT
jgi:hypothetical protein